MLKIGGQKVPTRTLLLVLCDAAMMLIGLLVGTALRFHNARMIYSYIQHPSTPYRVAWVVLTCVCALYYSDLYDSRVFNHSREMALSMLQALGAACLVLAVLYYIDPDHSLGRGIAVLSAPVILLLLLSWRLLAGASSVALHYPENMLILGTSPGGVELVREILQRPELNLSVAGFLDENGQDIGKSLVNPRIIGAVADVERIAREKKIDRVVLALKERRGQTPIKALLHLKFAGVGVEDIHTFNERITGRIVLEHLSPSWLILSGGFRKSTVMLAAKRATDILVSAVGLLLTWPIFFLIALAVWLESGLPIFFVQERVGLKGHSFGLLKFRSMRQDAEANGPQWATSDDNRVTPVGRFLRKTRLDELPQLWNVFRGEMSLVGPRPERPFFCQLLEEKIPLYALRHSVRPGITGWAQVKYQYGSSVEDAKAKLEYDFFYIKHVSPLLDFVILFETAKVVLRRRGAK
jgi:sugar transferase (PEP-CTERM system associated)